MTNLDTIEKIDAARAVLAGFGITLPSFELMRHTIDELRVRAETAETALEGAYATIDMMAREER